MSFWFDLDSQHQAAFEKWWFLQCCSSFRGSSSIWGARAPRVVKMASQLGILSSLAYQADSSSPFIHQTWIFCKENGSKRSFLPEIEVQTFWYTLYAVTTACCVPWQIWKNTAGKSASCTCPSQDPKLPISYSPSHFNEWNTLKTILESQTQSLAQRRAALP